MATTDKPLEIQEYIQIGLRRKWYIVIPLALSVLISFGVLIFSQRVDKLG